jgi:hypothetical protein
LAIEHIYKNGIQKRVHVVVKNHPFGVQVGLATNMWEGQHIDFNLFQIEARLVYDTDTLKEVSFVKMKPLDFKCTVNSLADQVNVEVRPKVLTSQLEDMLFRVKIVAVDYQTKQVVPNLYVYTESIKVVSKPEQVCRDNVKSVDKLKVKKKKVPSKPKLPPKKEEKPDDVNEMLSSHLSHIEASCDSNQTLLILLADSINHGQSVRDSIMNSTPSGTRSSFLLIIITGNIKQEGQSSTTSQTPFEKAFANFLESYDSLDQFEKPSKIRKLTKSFPHESNTLTEMLDTFTVIRNSPEPEKKKFFNLGGSDKSCNCNHCPFRQELTRIDEFYNNFLIAPEGIL